MSESTVAIGKIAGIFMNNLKRRGFMKNMNPCVAIDTDIKALKELHYVEHKILVKGLMLNRVAISSDSRFLGIQGTWKKEEKAVKTDNLGAVMLHANNCINIVSGCESNVVKILGEILKLGKVNKVNIIAETLDREYDRIIKCYRDNGNNGVFSILNPAALTGIMDTQLFWK